MGAASMVRLGDQQLDGGQGIAVPAGPAMSAPAAGAPVSTPARAAKASIVGAVRDAHGAPIVAGRDQ